MIERHRFEKSVKAYLLGILGERESAVLEERYFSDPAVFSRLRKSEDALIRDYLRSRLAPPDRVRFEGRYLVVPELMKRLQQIETEEAAGKHRASRMRLQLATVVLAFVVCATSWWFLNKPSVPPPRQPVAVAQETPPVNLHLTPGVMMSSAVPAELTNPVGKRLSLTLDIPGRTLSTDYLVSVAVVDPDGHTRKLWSGRARSFAGAAHTQQLVVEPNPSAWVPGDFIAEVDSVQGEPVEKYVFRIAPIL